MAIELDSEEFDDLMDRLPASVRHKVLTHMDAGELPDGEHVPKPEHFGLKFMGSVALGLLGLVLAAIVSIASVGVFIPVGIIIAFLGVIPLARTVINQIEYIMSEKVGGGVNASKEE